MNDVPDEEAATGTGDISFEDDDDEEDDDDDDDDVDEFDRAAAIAN